MVRNPIKIFLFILVFLVAIWLIQASKPKNTLPDVSEKEIGLATLIESLKLAKRWLLNNTNAQNGLLNYLYDPKTDRYLAENNHIRQLGTLYAITTLDRFFKDGSLTSLIKDTLVYYLKFKKQTQDYAFLNIDGEPNLAYNAFLIMSLLNTDNFPNRDLLLSQFARGILRLQKDDGSYNTHFLSEQVSGIDYYPGEAMLALIKLYISKGNKEYLDSVKKAFPYYKNYWQNQKNTAFVPWHTQAYLLLYKETGDKTLADFIFEMNDWLIDNHQITQTNNPNEIGGFPKDNPKNATSSYLEGINDAYALAQLLGDQYHLQKYRQSLKNGIRFILRTQLPPQDAAKFIDPIRAAGGFRHSLTNDEQRIDYTQHAIIALIKAVQNRIFEIQNNIFEQDKRQSESELSSLDRVATKPVAEGKDVESFRAIDKKYSPHIPFQIISDFYDRIGPQTMLDLISQNQACHVKGHNVGRVIFAKTNSLDASMQICGYRCSNGCFHGILMEMFKDQNKDSSDKHLSLEVLKNELKTFCDKKTVKDYIIKGNCTHGLGHVVAFLADYDIKKALSYCDLFQEAGLIYYCATGLYMEREQLMAEDDLKKSLFYPCDSDNFPAACFRYRIRISLADKFSHQDMALKCLEIKDQRQKQGCFHGLGFGYYKLIEEDPKKLMAVCGGGNTDDQRMCIEGAVGILSIANEDRAIEACSQTFGQARQACIKALKIGNFGMDRDFKLYYYKRE